jgi:hypothetical protein
MFVVQPFRKEPSIRSVLGFMSIATRWGDYLFPGITVLTRNLYAVQAMHQIAIEMRAWEPHRRHEFQSRKTDGKIARRLSEILAKKGIQRKPETLIQKMTYWQRYGSLFEFFDLLSQKRASSVNAYQQIIFDPNHPLSGNDQKTFQSRRIRHFGWYDRHRDRALANIRYDDVMSVFRGKWGNWKRWWLTGAKVPDGVPKAICLVRELEFFFTIWQTLFESAGLLAHERQPFNCRPIRTRHPTIDFLSSLLRLHQLGHQSEDCKRLIATCFLLHNQMIKPRLKKWEREVKNLIPEQSSDGFIKLHNDESIAEFGQRDGIDLLEALACLHKTYCDLQSKPYAVCISSFKNRSLGFKQPRISAEFTQSRWGLFGYRLEAALTLYYSADNS